MSGSHVDPALRSYVLDLLCGPEAQLRDRMRVRAEAAGMPAIEVEPEQARLLRLLARLVGAKRILDVGTLFGYSAAALAQSGPDVEVTTFEAVPKHAEVARANLYELGLAPRVRVVVGDARAGLAALRPDPAYDLMLIDADKEGYPAYFEEGLRLVRPGGLILADNVFAFGKVATRSRDGDVRAIQEFNESIARDSRVEATILPVGDGLLVARVLGEAAAKPRKAPRRAMA